MSSRPDRISGLTTFDRGITSCISSPCGGVKGNINFLARCLLSFRNQLASRGRWDVKGTGMNKDQLIVNNFIKAYNLHVKEQKASRFFITQSPPVGEMLKVIKRSSIVRPDILAVDNEERGLT